MFLIPAKRVPNSLDVTLNAALSAWDESRTEYGTRLVERGERMDDDRLHLGG